MSVARPHFPVEILAILDVPTAETQEYFAGGMPPTFRRFYGSRSKIYPLRNYAIQRARGRYVTFLSAENLVSGNWLLAAVSKAQAVDDDRTVFHPEYRFEFGPHPRVTCNVDIAIRVSACAALRCGLLAGSLSGRANALA